MIVKRNEINGIQSEQVIKTLDITDVKGVEPEKLLSIIMPLLKWLEYV